MKPDTVLKNSFRLADGFPTMPDYRQVVATSSFKDMEHYSQRFLEQHDFVAKQYRWGKDPLHQWSRQWEYPFVRQEIEAYLLRQAQLGRQGPVRILDAGSGITFFPFMITEGWPSCEIVCCDVDATLGPLYQRIKSDSSGSGQVKFMVGDLSKLPFESGHFDLVYSVSVLEHTQNASAIVGELRRLVKPGGALVLSFDIGLDGVSWLNSAEAQGLLNRLHELFAGGTVDVEREVARPDIVTSSRIAQTNKHLLPWVSPFISLVLTSWRRRRMPAQLRKNLTFYCGSFAVPRAGS